MDMQQSEELRELSQELIREHKAKGIQHDSWIDINEQHNRTQMSILCESAFCYGDRLDSNKVQVIIKARRKAGTSFPGIVETYVFNDSIPHHFAKYLKDYYRECWDWVCFYNNVQLADKAYTEKELKAAQNIKRKKSNKEHEQAYITLHEQTTVTCEETGISFSVKLPIPTNSIATRSTNLAILHPLAFFKNCEDVIRAYYKSGIRLEKELEPQVLAGMLLTILRHKNLIVCKDYSAANLFLQNATAETLAYAVRFFHNLPSSLMIPAVSLHLQDISFINMVLGSAPLSDMQKKQQQAEVFILNYIKACKGESTAKDSAHIAIAPKGRKERAKVKVYNDPTVAQHKAVKDNVKIAVELLDKIVKDSGGQHGLLFSLIRNNIKMLSFLSEKTREDIAHKIVTSFPNNNNALLLSRIFSETDTKEIENDLFSFTQQLEQDISEHKAKTRLKVDFASKLTSKKD